MRTAILLSALILSLQPAYGTEGRPESRPGDCTSYKYFCECYAVGGNYVVLNYKKLNRENGEITNLKQLASWESSSSWADCKNQIKENMICND